MNKTFLVACNGDRVLEAEQMSSAFVVWNYGIPYLEDMLEFPNDTQEFSQWLVRVAEENNLYIENYNQNLTL